MFQFPAICTFIVFRVFLSSVHTSFYKFLSFSQTEVERRSD